MRDVYERWPSDPREMTQKWERVAKGDQPAALAVSDFSDDGLDFDGFDSDDGDLDSAAGFDSAVGFDESLDEAAAPFVAGVAGVEAESDSVPDVLFFA